MSPGAMTVPVPASWQTRPARVGKSTMTVTSGAGRFPSAGAALARMRGGDLSVRAPQTGLAELAQLSDGVNALASHLADERAENRRLQSRMMTLAEAERARIASDLHDGIGPQLFALQAEIERICQRLGLPADPRKFAPHVTIARLRNTSPLEVAQYLSARGNFATMPFKVGRFVLMSSRDSVGGGPYIVEEAWKLSGSDERYTGAYGEATADFTMTR